MKQRLIPKALFGMPYMNPESTKGAIHAISKGFNRAMEGIGNGFSELAWNMATNPILYHSNGMVTYNKGLEKLRDDPKAKQAALESFGRIMQWTLPSTYLKKGIKYLSPEAQKWLEESEEGRALMGALDIAVAPKVPKAVRATAKGVTKAGRTAGRAALNTADKVIIKTSSNPAAVTNAKGRIIGRTLKDDVNKTNIKIYPTSPYVDAVTVASLNKPTVKANELNLQNRIIKENQRTPAKLTDEERRGVPKGDRRGLESLRYSTGYNIAGGGTENLTDLLTPVDPTYETVNKIASINNLPKFLLELSKLTKLSPERIGLLYKNDFQFYHAFDEVGRKEMIYKALGIRDKLLKRVLRRYPVIKQIKSDIAKLLGLEMDLVDKIFDIDEISFTSTNTTPYIRNMYTPGNIAMKGLQPREYLPKSVIDSLRKRGFNDEQMDLILDYYLRIKNVDPYNVTIPNAINWFRKNYPHWDNGIKGGNLVDFIDSDPIYNMYDEGTFFVKKHPNLPRPDPTPGNSMYYNPRLFLAKAYREAAGMNDFTVLESFGRDFSNSSSPFITEVFPNLSKRRMAQGRFPGALRVYDLGGSRYIHDQFDSNGRVYGNNYGNVNIGGTDPTAPLGSPDAPVLPSSGLTYGYEPTPAEIAAYPNRALAVNKINLALANTYKHFFNVPHSPGMPVYKMTLNGAELQPLDVLDLIIKAKGDISKIPNGKDIRFSTSLDKGRSTPMFATFEDGSAPLYPRISFILNKGGKITINNL